MSAYDFCEKLVEINSFYKQVVDNTVYTKDREFRIIYSQKFGDPRILLPDKKKSQGLSAEE